MRIYIYKNYKIKIIKNNSYELVVLYNVLTSCAIIHTPKKTLQENVATDKGHGRNET